MERSREQKQPRGGRDRGPRERALRLEQRDQEDRRRSVLDEVGVGPDLLLERGAVAAVAVGDLLRAALLDDVDAEPIGRFVGGRRERNEFFCRGFETESTLLFFCSRRN